VAKVPFDTGFVSSNPNMRTLVLSGANAFVEEIKFWGQTARKEMLQMMDVQAAHIERVKGEVRAERPDITDEEIAGPLKIGNHMALRSATEIQKKVMADLLQIVENTIQQMMDQKTINDPDAPGGLISRTMCFGCLSARQIYVLGGSCGAAGDDFVRQTDAALDVILSIMKPITDVFEHMKEDPQADENEPEVQNFRSKFGPAKTRIR
jgi:hypothetical protein